MAVNLSPVGGAAAQFFDNSGNVLTGGKLYTYSAGTTTPAVTYTTNSGATAHTNPIVLNAAGRVPDSGEIWLSDNLLYKFVLKDANDVQIAVWDNIDGINSNFVAYLTQNETQTATQGQTVFTLASIQYQPATNNLAVYVNGSKQVLTLNYTETSSTVVTFVDGLNVGDVVQFTTATAVATNVVNAANVSYNEGQAGAVNRNVEEKLQESISVLDFGADPTGVDDCTIAFQDAINAVLANGGGSIYIPRGTYNFPDADLFLDPGLGNIKFYGDGYNASIISYYEGITTTNYRGLFFNADVSTTKGNVLFEDLQFVGTLGTRPGRFDKVAVFLDYYKNVTFNRCKFYNIAAIAMDIHFGFSFTCADSYFENIAADCVRARDVSNCVVTNNIIIRNGDDAIAIHTSDTLTLDYPRQGILVEGNFIYNGGTIDILGGRVVNVCNNVIQFGNVAGVIIGFVGQEGVFPLRDINISNNMVLDLLYFDGTFSSSAASAFAISGEVPRGSSSTNGFIPGTYDTTASQWIYPWNYDYTNVTNTANPVALTPGVVISNNIVQRTQPAVAAFSDYNYGTRLWQGVGYDPAVTDANLRLANGVAMYSGGFNGVNISENVFESSSTGITLPTVSLTNQLINFNIENNVFTDITYNAIQMGESGSGGYTQNVKIDSNVFNLDVYRQNPNSNLDGTYDASGPAVPCAVNIGGASGFSLIDNTIQNVCLAFNAFGQVYVRDNTLICQPVANATGFSTTNKGIGTIEYAGATFRYQITYSDPTQSNYGQIINQQANIASSYPTTGYYVQGAFVQNINPAIVGNRTVIGWARLTTSSNNVLSTDWAQCVVATV